MKQKMEKEIRVRIQADLYNKFIVKCQSDFKTVSVVVRELIVKYIREKL
jgi:predicted DNA-binding protein